MHAIKSIALAGSAALIAVSTAAADIQIDFTGFDFTFNGSEVVDSGSNFGILDLLQSVDFYENGVLAGSLNAADGEVLNADVQIDGVSGIPVGGGVVTTGGGFFFDLYFDAAFSDRLQLDIGQVDIFYSGNQIGIAGITSAATVLAQNLPFDLELDENEPINITFSGLISNLGDDGTFVTSFDASGTGTVDGTAIPEPTSLALLGLGCVTLLRRRK